MTAWTVLDQPPDEYVLPLLNRDRVWAAYAICDLEPPFREHTRLFAAAYSGEIQALIVLHHLLGTTALLPFGSEAGLQSILATDVSLPMSAFVITQRHLLTTIETHYRLDLAWTMWRMRVTAAELTLVSRTSRRIRRLSKTDFDRVATLLKHSPSSFFSAAMLAYGVYFGVWEHHDLVAVAGTHVVSRQHRIAAIGNVYTAPEWRGHGLATAVTSAVAHELAGQGITDIVLNVREDNKPAIAAYRRIGFTLHRPFCEVVAQRCNRETPATG